MKSRYKIIIPCLVLTCLIACTVPQQTATYKSLYTVEVTTKTAVDSYYGLVIQGKVPTNDVPKVSRAYNKFQAAMTLAQAANQNNTNALAPSSLVIEGQDLVNLITTIKGAK